MEHPYGDTLDVAEAFIEAAGEQVQMYNNNYYGVVGSNVHPEDYAYVLENIIAPKVSICTYQRRKSKRLRIWFKCGMEIIL